ncbi:MAG: sucrase ferredoxin [Candidatus Binatia bacterium]
MTIPSSPPFADGPAAAMCSRLSAERGLPLIGSAGCYDGVLVFELDMPWTARLVGSRACTSDLDAAVERIGQGNVRLLAVEPRRTLRGGQHREVVRVLHFFKPQGAFGAFSLRQYDVRRERLASTLEQLAAGDAADAEHVACPPGVRDILVCTHGARDACCGKFGYRLFLELAALTGGDTSNVRLWRSSHLGGHRFAPTLLDLPSGRMFGRLGAGDAAAILGGGAPLLARLASIYRGRCALPEGVQIVERDLWLRTGHAFEPAALQWNVESAGDGWSVRLEAALAGAPPLAMTARVIRAEVDAVRTPASCGRDPEVEAPWRILE